MAMRTHLYCDGWSSLKIDLQKSRAFLLVPEAHSFMNTRPPTQFKTPPTGPGSRVVGQRPCFSPMAHFVDAR